MPKYIEQFTKQIKNEASIPVQSRVDIRILASLVKYYQNNDSLPGNMSGLISFSLDLLHKILIENDMINLEEFPTVENADLLLIETKLIQPSLRNRYIKKLFKAKGFENLRIEGVDPKEYLNSKEFNNREDFEPFSKRDLFLSLAIDAKSRNELPENITSDPLYQTILEEVLNRESERKESLQIDSNGYIVDNAIDTGEVYVDDLPKDPKKLTPEEKEIINRENRIKKAQEKIILLERENEIIKEKGLNEFEEIKKNLLKIIE